MLNIRTTDQTYAPQIKFIAHEMGNITDKWICWSQIGKYVLQLDLLATKPEICPTNLASCSRMSNK